MGARDADKPTAQVFGEVAEQTRLADELGYTIAWFAEHHFSNYCLCASPSMMVAHCASITKTIQLGTAVVVLPLYNPARLAAEIATADALSNGRLMLGIGAGYQPYEFERFGVDIARNLEMTGEFCDILDLAFSRDFFSDNGKHYQIPNTHILARPVQNPLPIYVAGHTQAMFRTAARHGYRVLDVRPGRRRQIAGRAVCRHRRRVCRRECARVAGASHGQPLCSHHRQPRGRDALRRERALSDPARVEPQAPAGGHARYRPGRVPFPDEPSLETIYDELLIGDVETVAEKLVAEIRATKPVHVCFSFKVGNTADKADALNGADDRRGQAEDRKGPGLR
jgi:alkanesulfonate monooxygenase SsuD/methylene tetrahydromethanopterin reductase-like flavin-dependent oxidoreductase (luciferase family)